jgi:predicted nucleic acid-binding Zn ribbon protein
MKCPLCGKVMTMMNQKTSDSAKEVLYYCERHGVMNKSSDLKEKADQIAKRT